MKKNDIFFERIIKKVLRESPDGEPTGAPPTGPTGAPPETEEVKYWTYENKQNTGPFTAEELKNKKWNDNSYVWPEKDGTGWVQVKTIPELSAAIKGTTEQTNKAATPAEPTDTDVAAAEGFFKYCPNVAKIMKSASENLLSKYTNSINAVTDPAEQERLKAEAYEKMAESNKNDLKNCEAEFKSSKTMTNADKENVLSQYRSTINNLLRKTAADLGKKALVGGVNLVTGLVTKKLTGESNSTSISANGSSGSQSGVSNAVAESLIRRNTKNHLIEIYNRKNRRRY